MDHPYLDTVIYDNFYEMLRGRYDESADTCAIRFMKGDRIFDITYHEMIDQIASVYGFLKNEGYQGRHIGIVSENRYEYLIIYLACVFDNVIVPIDKELDRQTVDDCVRRFDVDALFITDKTSDTISHISEDVKLYNIDALYKGIAGGYETASFFEDVKDTDKDRFAILASTSGTDGKMKGVMLSQYNVITNIRGTLENNVLKNPTLAFLPMNHTYGFNPCMLATLYNGTTLCLCLELKHLLRDLKSFDPFFFGAVPMVIEGMYSNILREIRLRKKERVFRSMLYVSRILLKVGIDLRHFFFGKMINKNLRLVVNGGAALNSEYVEKFSELGITILNGYGLTECSPTIAVSRVCNNVVGSAGTIMKNIDVKISDEGEIMVKGPCVMLGYYNDEKATQQCMKDGYFCTGDIGYIEGRVIYVTGRKKNLIILENGKNVAPEYLEDKINRIDYVKESLVVEKKTEKGNSILTALVVLSENASEEKIKQDIDKINETLPGYMHIDDYKIMSKEFEKNSSRKIIRSLYV